MTSEANPIFDATDKAEAQPPDGSWGLLLASLAHELRTPLSALIAFAEILKEEHFGPLGDPRYRAYAKDIHDSARHALGLVEDMLSGRRADVPVARPAFVSVDTGALVAGAIALMRPLAERADVVLAFNSTPHLPHVIADELSLRQMLLNLLSNAIKFARPGDRVTVEACYDRGGPLSISVVDTGPGMSPTERARFLLSDRRGNDPEKRSAGAGMGIGLPLSKALAAANGAALTIESTPGHGTRATISFAEDRIVAK
jgi:signal transduction histidine kinase